MAKIVSDRTARLVGGAALIGIAVQNALPAAGSEFTLPAFDKDGLLNVYVPAGAGIVALIPGLVPNSKLVAAAGLLVVGGNRVVLNKQTDFTAENILQGYLPLVMGALLLM